MSFLLHLPQLCEKPIVCNVNFTLLLKICLLWKKYKATEDFQLYVIINPNSP